MIQSRASVANWLSYYFLNNFSDKIILFTNFAKLNLGDRIRQAVHLTLGAVVCHNKTSFAFILHFWNKPST